MKDCDDITLASNDVECLGWDTSLSSSSFSDRGDDGGRDDVLCFFFFFLFFFDFFDFFS